MKIESAMKYLREGKKIFRESKPEFCLRKKEFGLYSFYVTIFDLLAEDWTVDQDLFDDRQINE